MPIKNQTDLTSELNTNITDALKKQNTAARVRNVFQDIIDTMFSLSGSTGGGDSYWTSGSTGAYSIKTNNDSGLDASGDYSVAEGIGSLASGNYSHSEGNGCLAEGVGSHSEGGGGQALGDYSHSENHNTLAQGFGSHSEGESTTASGFGSHSEGSATLASGKYSHSEGKGTTASGQYSHAGGNKSIASKDNCFAFGDNNQAIGTNTAVLGGTGITGSSSNTTYVPYLNVQSIDNNDSLSNILVRKADGTIQYRKDSSLPNTFTTGITFNNTSFILTETKNDGTSITANLAILSSDVTITGGSYNTANGIATFNNNSGGTFQVSGFTTGMTDTYTTGGTYSNGSILFNKSNATTYSVTGITDVYITGGTYSSGTSTFTNNTGGTFNITGFYTGYTAPTDIRVTGGTYSNGTTILTNNTGGTLSITGYTTGNTDTFVTGFTYNNANTFSITNNTGGTLSLVASTFTGITTGTLSATTYNNLPSVSTYQNLVRGNGLIPTATSANTYYLMSGNGSIVNNTSGNTASSFVPAAIYISSADYPSVNGYAPKLRIRAMVATNAVAPTGRFTLGLHSMSSPASAGSVGVRIWNISTALTGSTGATQNTPSANTIYNLTSSDFSLPADGLYCICITTTATTAANSYEEVVADLQIHNI